MPQQLIKKIQLAALGGCSRAFVTQESRDGGIFRSAVVGQRIDVAHPCVVEWLQSRDVDPTKASTKGAKKSPKSTKSTPATTSRKISPAARKETPGIDDSGSSEDVAEWAHLTIAEVTDRFGGEPQFANWLKAIKEIEAIRGLRLRNEELSGSLIRRDFVETFVLGLVEEQHQRLLSELPRTLAKTIRAHSESKVPLEQSERQVRKDLGKLLKATQSKVVRLLRK